MKNTIYYPPIRTDGQAAHILELLRAGHSVRVILTHNGHPFSYRRVPPKDDVRINKGSNNE